MMQLTMFQMKQITLKTNISQKFRLLGIERVLRKNKHFQAQIGNEIFVKLFKPLEKQKEIRGILKNYSEDEMILIQDEKEIKIEVKNIALARTVFDW